MTFCGLRSIKLYILHTLKGHQLLSYCLDLLTFSIQDYNFKAVIMVQMNMYRGLDQRRMVMLYLSKRVCQSTLRVVVDQSDSSNTPTLNIAHPFVMSNVASDGIPYTLRTGRISSLLDYAVEFRKKILWQRNTNSH